ncbi:MAG: ligase-associated DNA damage response endonuclease PdeM [Gemmobacter sp.]
MDGYAFHLAGADVVARPSGALYWPEAGLLCVADLHLGRSQRLARRGGALLPPYETEATLARLDADLAATNPATVVCLGDSFDDLSAEAELDGGHRLWLCRMMAGRAWVWIAGNHDPGPLSLGGTHRAQWRAGPLTFRHIAAGDPGEVSAHYHPKWRIAGRTRPCFVTDGSRLVLPAYGTYTGGLSADDPGLRGLFGRSALAILTGVRALAVPLPPGTPGEAKPSLTAPQARPAQQ